MVQKLLAAATGATMLLSAAPAFALSIGTSADVESAIKLRALNATAETSADASVEADVKAQRGEYMMELREKMKHMREKCEEDRDSEDCKLRFNKAGHMNAGVAARADVTISAEDKMEYMHKRVMHATEHMINHLARMTKRLCGMNDASDDATVQKCVSSFGARIKANISAMIDASFGL